MKITLDASIKEHREIAELFRGCEEFITGQTFIAIVEYSEDEYMFVSDNTQLLNKITIDLDQAKPNLRMALGTGIEFDAKNCPFRTKQGLVKGVVLKSITEGGKQWVWGFKDSYPEFGFVTSVSLSVDYLKSVGVEVEEQVASSETLDNALSKVSQETLDILKR